MYFTFLSLLGLQRLVAITYVTTLPPSRKSWPAIIHSLLTWEAYQLMQLTCVFQAIKHGPGELPSLIFPLHLASAHLWCCYLGFFMFNKWSFIKVNLLYGLTYSALRHFLALKKGRLKTKINMNHWVCPCDVVRALLCKVKFLRNQFGLYE